MKTAIGIFLFIITTAAHSACLEARLEAIPVKTLPGIPVTLRVTIINNCDALAPRPTRMMLIAVPSTSAPFVAKYDGYGHVKDLPSVEDIPARGSSTFEFPADGVLLPTQWWGDERLDRPDSYLLEAVFTAPELDVKLAEETRVEIVRERGFLRTSSAALTVEEPHGADRVTWDALVTAAGGRWHGRSAAAPAVRAVAAQIVRENPKSIYAGWFAASGIGDSDQENAAELRSWLSHASRDEYTAPRQLRLALWETSLAEKFVLSQPDLSRKYAAQARALLTPLAASPNAQLRSRARERLELVSKAEAAVEP